MLTTLYNICTQVCGVVWTLLSCALQFQVSVTIRTCVTSWSLEFVGFFRLLFFHSHHPLVLFFYCPGMLHMQVSVPLCLYMLMCLCLFVC